MLLNLFELALKRPTSMGLNTGPFMFSPAEVERLLKDKSVRRFMCFHK